MSRGNFDKCRSIFRLFLLSRFQNSSLAKLFNSVQYSETLQNREHRTKKPLKIKFPRYSTKSNNLELDSSMFRGITVLNSIPCLFVEHCTISYRVASLVYPPFSLSIACSLFWLLLLSPCWCIFFPLRAVIFTRFHFLLSVLPCSTRGLLFLFEPTFGNAKWHARSSISENVQYERMPHFALPFYNHGMCDARIRFGEGCL